MKKILIANRAEIAIRIARAATDLGLESVAVFARDDAASPHVRRADSARALVGRGAAAYLDSSQIVRVALESGCDAVHPGYGFLSEDAAFVRHCEDTGLTFVGPTAETLESFGDKGRARELAREQAVPLAAGTFGATSLAQAQAFFAGLGPRAAMMIKALHGGGGRGMRAVRDAAELEDAYARCRSEALAAFGNSGVYVERLLERARHVEVQIAGDGRGRVAHLFDRDCSLQRRHQKLVEIAPAPGLTAHARERLIDAALRLARAVDYRNLGTFEFLIDADGDDGDYAFIEANPRLQVEHTVTEELTGIDLVQTQLRIAAGEPFETLGWLEASAREPRGFAVQARVNMETMTPSGDALPSGGTLQVFEMPSGPGVRVDTFGLGGYATSPSFDSLLAKIIVRSDSPNLAAAFTRLSRALSECRVTGVATNVPFLSKLAEHPVVRMGRLSTRFIEDHIAELVPDFDVVPNVADESVLEDFASIVTRAPMQASVVSVDVVEGDVVRAAQPLLVLSAMKMEHVIAASSAGLVMRVDVRAGDVVGPGQALLVVQAPADDDAAGSAQPLEAEIRDPASLRPDLVEVLERRAATLDEARPGALARRHATRQRSARENIADLCDPGTFVEHGGLLLPAQRRRRSVEELIAKYPADGLVCGVGDINGASFDAERTRCMVLAYDYTVFAGTQGAMNHKKTDRMFEFAHQYRLPIVLFAEGGGGRPGDTDWPAVAGLDVMTFAKYARLSGSMPRIGIVAGRCFAGNAALLGCSDVIIATENATIGMGGPAMIEGGGLGVYTPEEVGPIDVMSRNGVVDVVVTDEAAAVAAAKRYLAYFQGTVDAWTCADQRKLRSIVPENRLRVYDVRNVLETLLDADSVLELRRAFAPGMITALARVEGRALGVVASNPMHLAGAIDSDGADKAARFMQLCDAFDLPLLFLCDTPGIMVGPDAEKTALVRHAARLFTNAASVSVPLFTIVLRKGYGLGAQAMAGGSFHAGAFTVSWPTGEFGAMGLEGAVRLGYRKELAAVEDAHARKAVYERMVAEAYERGKALNMATFLEIDDVIDPADSRRWIVSGLRLAPLPGALRAKRRTIDTW
ncbi:MAG: carbamoyl-phosphate synthase large subunit [Candidatus Eremiobacteraeota bacterium]|nr:carbamoyl-phosphate synthase large subunit [Candidatus Eremiobacteraeota bacterium]